MRIWFGVIVLALPAIHPAIAGDEGADISCRVKRGEDYYPPEAIRRNQVGAVLVEYSVIDSGATTSVLVVQSRAPNSLKSAALRLVKGMNCTTTLSWKEAGGPGKRRRANILFKLRAFDETAAPIEGDAEKIEVIADAISPRQ